MERFPVELLVYGALFLAILLFNYATRRMRQRPQPQDAAPEYEGPSEDPPSAEYESSEEFWGRVQPSAAVAPLAPAPDDRVERPRPPDPALLRRKRHTRRSLLGSKRDLRRAIVLMTVLGPARATETSQPPGEVRHPA